MASEKKNKFQLHPIQIGLEIAIVAVGILIAFQLCNWRMTRDRAKTEVNILKEIKSNLELDMIDIKGNLVGHTNKLAYIDSLRNYQEYRFNQQEIGKHLFQIFRDYGVTPQTSAFETLKAKGVDLITNDSLRMKVLRLYDFYYVTTVKLEEEWDALKFDNELRYISETYFNRFDMINEVVLIKSENNRWLENPDVQIRIDFVNNNLVFVIKFYEILIGEINDTIAAIDKELESK